MEYGKMDRAELRKHLREIPTCRGRFASDCSRDMAIAILGGTVDPEKAVEEWEKRILFLTKESQEVQANIPEAGEHKIVEAPPEEDRYSNILEFCDKLAGLEPTMSDKIRGMCEAYKKNVLELDELQKVKSRASDIVTEAAGTTVKIGKVEYPVVKKAQDAHVPVVDPYYRFGAWNAKLNCGPITYENDCHDVFKLLLEDKRVLLGGPPSVGKTSLIAQFCAATRWPMTRINCNRDLTQQDFLGVYEAKNNATEFVDGPLTEGMKNGHVIIFDEFDHSPAECLSLIHPCLEPKGRLINTINGGEVIVPHENTRYVATSNTLGYGDESTAGMHVSAQVQDSALLSRFDYGFQVDWMKPKDEADILVSYGGVKLDDAKAIVRVAAHSREAVNMGEISFPITLRQTLAWASGVAQMGMMGSFAVAVLSRMPVRERQTLSEFSQRVFGEE